MAEMNLLKKLCGAFGPSGMEDEVVAVVKYEITPYCDRTEVDSNRTLIAHYARSGHGKRVIIAVHTDEPGMMITHADDDGYLHFEPLGKSDPRFLYGKRVTVGNEHRKMPGVICSKPLHLVSRSERNRMPQTEDLYIDVGAENKHKALELVSPGDYATYSENYIEFGTGGEQIISKALADRAPCYAVISAFEALYKAGVETDFDLYAVFGSCERVRYSGSAVSAERLNPDYAFMVSAVGTDTYGCGDGAGIGKGVVLPLRGKHLVYDREQVRFISETANKHSIPYVRIPSFDGFDSDAALQRVCGGVYVCNLAIPCIVPDAGVSLMKKKDINDAASLLFHILRDYGETARCVNGRK